MQKPRSRKVMGLNQYLDPNFFDLRPSAWPTEPQCIPSHSISKKSKQAVLIRAWEWSVIAALNRKYMPCCKALRPWIIQPAEQRSKGSRPSIGFLKVHSEGGGGQLSLYPQRPGPVPGCMRSVLYIQGGAPWLLSGWLKEGLSLLSSQSWL